MIYSAEGISFTQEKPFISHKAQENLHQHRTELQRRKYLGLASEKVVSPHNQISVYLEGVKRISPVVDTLTDRLVQDNYLVGSPDLIIGIPAVGFGNQEQESLLRTLSLIQEDPLITNKRATVLVFVNRPEGEQADSTTEQANTFVQETLLDCIIFDHDMPITTGNNSSTFSDDMAAESGVPFGLLRDILNISAMKLWQKSQSIGAPPIMLKMDADFVGFKKGRLGQIVDLFDQDPQMQLLQCTSDWEHPDPNKPIKNNQPLWMGSELMRDLPQILKKRLGEQTSEEMLQEIIFGEAIQRGLQVPQAERMESIARKGGFGLNRVQEEHDTNIRMTAVSSGLTSVASTDEVIFNWDSRRAEAAWLNFQMPPIAQWAVPCLTNDPVRTTAANGEVMPEATDNVHYVVNRTLARLPFSHSLLSTEPAVLREIADTLRPYLSNDFPVEFTAQDTGEGTVLLQLTA